MRPIVHIGYHKTATTWFQKCVYPAATSHALIPRAATKAALVTPDAFHFDPAEARRALTPACGRPPVLCEEGLSGYLHNGGLRGHLSKAVAERIRDTFPDAQIVVFVRQQPGMIAGTYQQYVRGGGTYGPARYLFPAQSLHGAFAEPDKIPRFSFGHFEYDRLIALYDDLFRATNVHVLLYEELRQDWARSVREIARRTGLEIDPAAVRAGRENASYALPLVMLARAANHFTRRTVLDKRTLLHVPGWYYLRGLALERLNRSGLFGRSPSPERLLGRPIVHHVRARYAESNRRLAVLRPALALERCGYPLIEQRGAAAIPVLSRRERVRLRVLQAGAAATAAVAGLFGSLELLGV